ncbi:MAG: hypothetical protein R3F43_12825 [bacterium]
MAFAASYFGIASPVPVHPRAQGRGRRRPLRRQHLRVSQDDSAPGRYHRLGVGVAAAGAERVVVVLLQPVQVDLAPGPREAALGATLPVRGRLTA